MTKYLWFQYSFLLQHLLCLCPDLKTSD
jgi:hypothetical protein